MYVKDFKKPAKFGAKSFGARGSYGPKRGTSSYGARSFDAPTERFQATCNECQAKCEVPFRPNGKKPVYCRDCFKGKEEAPAYGAPREYRKESPSPVADLTKQFELLNTKLDRLIKVIESSRS